MKLIYINCYFAVYASLVQQSRSFRSTNGIDGLQNHEGAIGLKACFRFFVKDTGHYLRYQTTVQTVIAKISSLATVLITTKNELKDLSVSCLRSSKASQSRVMFR